MNLGRFCFIRCYCIATLGALFSVAAAAQHVTKDVRYITGPEGAQFGGLYQPAGSGPFPAIVYLHGGSWRSGSRKDFTKLATDLAAQGYVGFSVDYDLKPSSFPVSWQEAQAAVRFVRSHAAEYHVDPNAIVVAGTSAGGELAALVALAPNGPAMPASGVVGPPETTLATVAAAVILNGVFDLNSSAHVITRYLGGECQTVQAACSDASPQQHIHAGAPPFFVGHGTGDSTVPYAEAKAFVDELQRYDIAVKLYTAENGPHMYWTKKEYYDANLAAVESFLAGVLHPSGTTH